MEINFCCNFDPLLWRTSAWNEAVYLARTSNGLIITIHSAETVNKHADTACAYAAGTPHPLLVVESEHASKITGE